MRQPDSADPLLARAVHLHQTGDVAGAITLYQDVVAKAPHHVAALNLLGLAHVQIGKAEEAVPLLQKALTLDPELPSGHYNLGTILQGLKRYEQALQHYQLALAQQPNDVELRNNLGTVLRALNRADEAIPHFRKAIELKPQYAEAHCNLGNALHTLGRGLEACAAFERAVALNPRLAEAHTNWGHALTALGRHKDALARFEVVAALNSTDPEAHLNRGNALQKLGRHTDAIACYETALALDPAYADAHISLGAAFNALQRHDEGISHCRRALAIKPDSAQAALNLGNALQGLLRFEEAIATFQEVAARKPDHGMAHFCLGFVLEALDRNEEALRSYDRAIELMPGDDLVKWNKAHLELSLGHFEEGWRLFEKRWSAHGLEPRPYQQPRWDGGYVDGTLLVWAEHGLGDQILHASMIDELRSHAKSICLEVEPRLVPLFARSFPNVEVVPLGAELYAGPATAHEPLPSLGRYLRPSWQSFKCPEQGYLKADLARSTELRTRLAEDGRYLIGLSWQSRNPTYGQAKTARLQDFASLLRIPNCRFIDLQYGDTAAERDAVRQELAVQVERVEDVDNLNDIEALAALITACDLVLTVSNTTAHLSGALGKPTWILLPFGNARFWYWFRDRQDSPWYPRVRITRQARGQTWADLIAKLAPEIARAADPGHGGEASKP
jgi:tetratricopeptide (TPR) repeat protein